MNETAEQAANALRNIGNHLEVNPKAKIVVVTHARGMDLLFEGARDKNGNPYNVAVEDLKPIMAQACRRNSNSRLATSFGRSCCTQCPAPATK